MSSAAKQRWDALRVLFEKHSIPADLLARASGLECSTVIRRSVKESWQNKKTRAGDLLERLRSALSKQIAEIEPDLELANGFDEKAARTLATLARTWEKLMELEKGMMKGLEKTDKKSEPFELSESELDELRTELERRIRALGEEKTDTSIHRKPINTGVSSNTQ